MIDGVRAALAVSMLTVSLGASPTSLPVRTWMLGWPMAGHDPQRTNRASVDGPIHPHLLWTRKHLTAIVVGSNGTIYGTTQRPGEPAHPIAVSASGRREAQYRTTLTPAGLSPSGVVFTIGFERRQGQVGPAQPADAAIAGFSHRGRRLWRIQPAGLLKGAEPLVSEDGTLYAPFEGMGEEFAGLDLIGPDGRQRYLQRGVAFFAVALASDGAIYALTFTHDSGKSSLEALDPAGNLRWQRVLDTPLEGLGCRCLLVGRDGTVYATDGPALLALDTTGQLVWRRQMSDGALALGERADGVILVAGHHLLTAVDSSGRQLWTSPIGRTSAAQLPSLIGDAAGRAYVAAGDGVLSIVSAQGQVLSRLNVAPPSPTVPSASLFLDPKGRLVVSGQKEVLMYGP